jgi:DNA repair exonuclease SbcCD ATPase subunit
MAYLIGKVVYHNFMCFKHAEVDFSENGLTLIEGEALDSFGCASNGSGKSTLLDGIAWCLFDRCLRPKYNGDDIIRLEWKGGKLTTRNDGGGTWVEVNITGGERSVVMRHYRKDLVHKDRVYLYVDDKDVSRGTNAQTFLAFEQLIGLDFSAFTNSVAFGVREDVKSFLAAPDSDRKAILEKILGLELYSDAQQVASRDLRATAEELNRLELKRSELQSALMEQRAALTSVQAREDGDDNEMKLLQQKAKLVALRRAGRDLDARFEEASASAQTARERYDEAMAQYEAQRIEFAKKRNAATTAVREAAVAKGRSTALGDSVLERLGAWQKLSGKECPTCTQEVPAELVESVAKTMHAELKEHTSVAALKHGAIVKAEAAVKALVEPELPSRTSLQDAMTRLNTAQQELNTLNGELAGVESALAAWESAEAQSKGRELAITKRITALESELTDAETIWSECNKRSDALGFWVDGFGNSGIKSFLIEAEIPEINRRASTYAQELLGKGAFIKLSATKQLKTKATLREELSIEVVIPNCTKGYEGASKGQKHRLNLSILLACRDIVGERSTKSFRQFFADELFDGLDSTGCKVIVSMLRGVAADCPVALISHDARIKTAADRVFVVRHKNGIAELIARGPGVDTDGVGAAHGRAKQNQG